MNIEKEISSAVISAVSELYGQNVPENMVQLQKTKATFEGNLTLVVFPFLKISHKRPEETAEEIGRVLIEKCKAIASFNVVKGFLNLVIAREAWGVIAQRYQCKPTIRRAQSYCRKPHGND